MVGTVVDLKNQFGEVSDDIGRNVGYQFDHWDRLRREWIEEKKELRNYIFATDTNTTTNGELPWKNSTTVPKLCQIRDNLHANYMSTLFPNSRWMKWFGDTDEDDMKANMIEGFMYDLTEKSNLKTVVSQLLYDYIDSGNVFADVTYERELFTDEQGVTHAGYEGPVVRRIAPFDIVFNPLASQFKDAPKILRKVLTIGEIQKMASLPGNEHWQSALDKSLIMRSNAGGYTVNDYDKALGFAVDGFSDMREYYGGNYVEVLEFKGDYHDAETNTLYQNQQIIVIDRSITVYKGQNKSWLGNKDVVHSGWRKRPDNLYAMGPLDNLVGMQYRIDHLENLKADALDLMVHPPLKVKGDVEAFTWGPGAEISIIGDGDIEELGKNFSGVAAANNEIAMLEMKMEQFAGAPRESMGVRTPGEKTAFEVQTLEASASRIFQEKIAQFERDVLEPILNMMLATARQYMTGATMTRIHDSELDMELFQSLQPEDVNGNGSVRPRGARHFGEQAIMIQNVNQLFSGPLGQIIQPHISTEMLAKMVEDLFNLDEFKLIRRNQGLTEQADQLSLANNLDQVVTEQAMAPVGENIE